MNLANQLGDDIDVILSSQVIELETRTIVDYTTNYLTDPGEISQFSSQFDLLIISLDFVFVEDQDAQNQDDTIQVAGIDLIIFIGAMAGGIVVVGGIAYGVRWQMGKMKRDDPSLLDADNEDKSSFQTHTIHGLNPSLHLDSAPPIGEDLEHEELNRNIGLEGDGEEGDGVNLTLVRRGSDSVMELT